MVLKQARGLFGLKQARGLFDNRPGTCLQYAYCLTIYRLTVLSSSITSVQILYFFDLHKF